MYKINSFIILCCFTLFFGCNEDINIIFDDINITTENNSTVEINIPKAKGDNTISSAINTEIKKLVISNLQIGNQDAITETTIEESIDKFNTEFKNFKTKFPETHQIWEAQIDGEIMCNSPSVISLALTSYLDTGGAHGLMKINFLNIKTSTGEKITANDFINDIEAFKRVAEPYFQDAIKDKTIFESELNSFNLPENIGYSSEGIILLYNAYEIAPYSSGIIEFVVPFEAIESYITL